MEKEGRTVIKKHSFGARADVRGALAWLDEGTLLYPVGKTVALHAIAANHQRFLDTSYRSTGVSALAVSANRKFVAVAEGGADPQVQIIDVTTRKRRKVLSVPDLGSDRFTALAFSADGRHIVTQGGAPAWRLLYWNWERSRPLASVSLAPAMGKEAEAPAMGGGGGARAAGSALGTASGLQGPLVTSVAVCPSDALTLTASGVGFLRYYRYAEGLLQPLPSCGYPREQQEVFVAHAWLDGERVVASTKHSAGLILVDKGRYVGPLAMPPRATGYLAPGEKTVVTAISATKKGFVAAMSNGAVSVYEKNPNAPDVSAYGGHSSQASTSSSTQAAAAARSALMADDENAGENANSAAAAAEAQRELPYERLCTLFVPAMEPGEQTVNDTLQPDDTRAGRHPSDSLPTGKGSPHAATGAAAAEDHGSGGGDSSSDGNGAAAGASAAGAGKSTGRRARRFQLTARLAGDDGEAAHESASTASAPADSTADGASRIGGTAAAAAAATVSGIAAEASSRTAQPAVSDGAANAVAFLGAAADGSPRLPHGIAALAVDQGEAHLAVLTFAGKIYAVDFQQNWAQVQRDVDAVRVIGGGARGSLASSGPSPVRRVDPADPSGGVAPAFLPVCEPFHSGAINGMDCSVRKPFLVTASSDRSIRMWNTATHRLEMCVFFAEEPGAVAIHPSGLMLVVCFPTCVRVMSVLWNSLRDRRTINFRGATGASFAHGGHFFAVTHGNLVDLFYSATCELHGQLRGHPQKIEDLKWCSTTPYPTDNRLLTCSLDGMIMYWSAQDARKEAEHSDNKKFRYVAIAADDRFVWAVGAPTSATALDVQWRTTLREMDRHVLGSANASSDDYEFTDTALTTLRVAPHQRMLFGGSDDGALKVMTLPLQAGMLEAPLPAHAGRITQMAVSHDETTLFTAGSDGSLFMWEIRDDGMLRGAATAGGGILAKAAGEADGLGVGAARDVAGYPYGTNEVLVTQQEVEEQKVEVESLQQQIEKLKTDIDSDDKRRSHEQGTRMRERVEEFKGDAANLASNYAALWNAKEAQERSFVAVKLEKETEAAHELEHAERMHQAEVHELEELCDDLQHTLEREEIQHAADLQALTAELAQAEVAAEERYADVVSQRQQVLERLTRQVDRARQTNEETMHQLERDTDAESQEVGGKHHGSLKLLRERFLRMKGDSAVMRKSAARMEREIDVRVGELRLLDSAKTALSAQLQELGQRTSQLHQDIDERDAVLGEREKNIYALKKHNQDLEKYKFVLDHHIRQLKAQIEPKQREIVLQHQRMAQRNDELEQLHSSNVTLRASIDELKSDLTTQQAQTKQLLKTIKDSETYKGRFLRDVGDIAGALQEPPQLRETVERLYQAHVVTRGGTRVAAANPQIKQEFADQVEYLSTSVAALRRKLAADQQQHRGEVSALMAENLCLIKEIHGLRGEAAELRTAIAAEDAIRRAGGALGASRSSHSRSRRTPALPSTKTRSAAAPGPMPSASAMHMLPPATKTSGSSVVVGGAEGSRRAVPATSTARGRGSGRARLPVGGASVGRVAPDEETVRDGADEDAADAAPTVTVTEDGARGSSGRAPEPPAAIEENRRELRMMRAYVEVLERALAENPAQRPASAAAQRLPPIASADTVQADLSATR